MNPIEIAELVERTAAHGVIVDSNLLLLLAIGRWRREQIARSRRLSGLDLNDYDHLVALVSRFHSLHLLPNILTEVSNLLSAEEMHVRTAVQPVLIAITDLADETYVASSPILSTEHFARLGLTDLAIAELAGSSKLVVTLDGPLSRFLAIAGTPVLNWNDMPHRQ